MSRTSTVCGQRQLALPFTSASRGALADRPRRSTPPRPAWRRRSRGSRISPPGHADRGGALWVSRPVRSAAGYAVLSRHCRTCSMPVRLASRATWISHRLTCPLRSWSSARSRAGSASRWAPLDSPASRDRPQARGVENVGDQPFGHHVHDPGPAGWRGCRFRPDWPARAVISLPVSVASIATEPGPRA